MVNARIDITEKYHVHTIYHDIGGNLNNEPSFAFSSGGNMLRQHKTHPKN